MGYSEDADFVAPDDVEDLTTQVCFRCKDMAVIDRSALKYIPAIMAKSDALLGLLYQASTKDEVRDEVNQVRARLKQYIILLDMVPQDD